MEKKVKVIVIGIVVLVLVGLLVYVSFDVSGPGSLIGGLTVLWAMVKSKIFGIKSSDELVEDIKTEHQEKRENWEKTKEEYDAKIRMLQAQMAYVDYRSALISEKINTLDEYQKQKLNEIKNASVDDLLKMINERYNKPEQ